MLALNLPVNGVSFGQVSTALLREAFRKNMEPSLFLVGDSMDLSSQEEDSEFQEWLDESIIRALDSHDRENPIFKLWHINGSIESFSKNQVLLSFYELDSPTPVETNIVKNNSKVLFSSKYSCDIFRAAGVETGYMPLAFDSDNFKTTNKTYFQDDRITFTLAGKLEKRKNHDKVIKTWLKRFANDNKYFLNCAIYNSFLSPEDNNSLIANIVENKKYPNVQFLGHMSKNSIYNDFLNVGDIVLGLSGGEGWGLPEFQSVCLGSHGVIMDAHGYKGWANSKNSTLVSPAGKIDAADGIFFKKGFPFNQGEIFDFNEDEFIAACEDAIKKVESNRINEEGLKTAKEFTISKMLDQIILELEQCRSQQ